MAPKNTWGEEMNTKPSHQTRWDAKKGQWVTVDKSNSKPPKVYPQGSSGTPPGELYCSKCGAEGVTLGLYGDEAYGIMVRAAHFNADKSFMGDCPGKEGLPPGEPVKGKTLVADGWVYRDLPRMTQEAMGILLGVIGEDNYEFLTSAKYPDKEHGVAVRGQVMISPLGMENLILHASKSKESDEQG